MEISNQRRTMFSLLFFKMNQESYKQQSELYIREAIDRKRSSKVSKAGISHCWVSRGRNVGRTRLVMKKYSKEIISEANSAIFPLLDMERQGINRFKKRKEGIYHKSCISVGLVIFDEIINKKIFQFTLFCKFTLNN